MRTDALKPFSVSTVPFGEIVRVGSMCGALSLRRRRFHVGRGHRRSHRRRRACARPRLVRPVPGLDARLACLVE